MVITSIVLLIFAILSFLMVFMFPFDGYCSESNTTEFTATVSNINIDEGHGAFIIHIEEYAAELWVFGFAIIDFNEISMLRAGQTIIFRTRHAPLENPKNAGELTIHFLRALRTQDKEIVTLESYNSFIKEGDRGIKITFGVFGSITLLIAITLLVIVFMQGKGKRIRQRIEKRKQRSDLFDEYDVGENKKEDNQTAENR